MPEINLVICNKVGLHARPAVLFVQAAQGLDEFSMGAAAIPLAKELIRKLSVAETQPLAQEALKQATAARARELVKKSTPAQTPRSSTE